MSEEHLLKDMKVKYNHWFAKPFPFKMKKGRVYGRVFGKTVYFTFSKDKISKYTELARHELEHLYQTQRHGGTFIFSMKYFFESFKMLFKKFSFYEAYYYNKFEVEARDKAKTERLTEEEKKFFGI